MGFITITYEKSKFEVNGNLWDLIKWVIAKPHGWERADQNIF
jgi:hypothetical protein